ncbi:hypothetical protein [Kitasatospora sp. NPDC050543]|uniref:hypothetical protein n=1 Tax=Kitasatospora sp. NPDC050543 TaxID=3364054 RepID=UPI00379656BD
MNFLAAHLLAKLLRAPLSASRAGRIVNVSSSLHRTASMNWTDPHRVGYLFRRQLHRASRAFRRSPALPGMARRRSPAPKDFESLPLGACIWRFGGEALT